MSRWFYLLRFFARGTFVRDVFFLANAASLNFFSFRHYYITLINSQIELRRAHAHTRSYWRHVTWSCACNHLHTWHLRHLCCGEGNRFEYLNFRMVQQDSCKKWLIFVNSFVNRNTCWELRFKSSVSWYLNLSWNTYPIQFLYL